MSSIHRIWNVTRLFFSAALAVAALLLVAQAHSSSAAAVPADPIHTLNGPISDVAIFNFGFNPAVITITAGSTVRWTNTTLATTHTSSSDNGVWDSGFLGAGSVFTHTFDVPGIYSYHCNVHLSMHGVVVVLPPQPPTGVSLAGPSVGKDSTVYTFTANVSPITATLPITYSWQSNGQPLVTHSGGGLTDTIVLSWTASMTGAQWITTTATNEAGSAIGSHLIIIDPLNIYLPLIMK
jgi:plastocyanin